MGLYDGKTALVFGVANKHSIAWGIARALHEQGAEVGFSYAMERLEKRVRPLAESVGSRFIEPCDVTDDAAIDRLFERVAEVYGTIDVLVHSIAYAEREDLEGEFVSTSRQGWRTALEVSAYSLVALTQRAAPLMPNGGAVVTLTALGGDRVLPNYNVMGVAKAALEASVRYLAADLGPRGIRVNAISAGPIKTLAAHGVSGFRDMYRTHEQVAPMRRLITPEDVGRAAVYLCSDWASATTGEVLFVDGGWNVMGVTMPLGGK
ncbi:MAG TPA: enoyl-ACP reductase [Aggregatilineales bacterium]|nr:enoyl-ACP reductase [Aggregatilineales bacterium]